ncbi:MAG: hypothetical protein H2069_00240 [Legionella sp.]|nr:hypothetical protein [Legionella sp.]
MGKSKIDLLKYFWCLWCLFRLSVVFAHPQIIDTRTEFQKLMSQQPYVSPNVSIAIPSAYGIGWGAAFLGAAGQLGTTTSTRPFGQYGVGFGLGDPNKYLGLATALSFGGLDDITRDGNFSFQLAHNFMKTGSAIAIGAQNGLAWGSTANGRLSYYLNASKVFPLDFKNGYAMNIIGTIGVGNARFVRDIGAQPEDYHRLGPFGSVALQLLPQVTVIGEYVGKAFNTGLSVIPFTKIPLVATIATLNLNTSGRHIPIAGGLAYVIFF